MNSKHNIFEANVNRVLKLNQGYWQARQINQFIINPFGHYYYMNEDLINHEIHKCLLNFNYNQYLEAFDIFKQNNVDFDVRSQLDNTSLLYDYAFYNPECHGNYNENIQQSNNQCFNAMKLLLDYGANPDFSSKNKNPLTCLMRSVQNSNRFKLLLDYNADPFFIPGRQQSNIHDYITNLLDQIENKNYCENDQFELEELVFYNKINELKISKQMAQSELIKQNFQVNNSHYSFEAKKHQFSLKNNKTIL